MWWHFFLLFFWFVFSLLLLLSHTPPSERLQNYTDLHRRVHTITYIHRLLKGAAKRNQDRPEVRPQLHYTCVCVCKQLYSIRLALTLFVDHLRINLR